MKIDPVKVLESTVALLAVLIFYTLVVRYEFPAFEYASPPRELIEIETSAIGPEVGLFLWSHRIIDLIAQAFVLFAAAACCAAVLRTEEER